MTDPADIERRGTTIWRRIERCLAREIEEGGFSEAGKLPGEQHLALRFGVNRHTVRHAMSALVERGIIERVHGKGCFVREIVLDYPIRERTSFSANLLEQGLLPGYDVRSIEAGVADTKTASVLEIRTGNSIVISRSLGSADGTPIAVGITMFAQERLPGIDRWLRKEKSISKALAACGFPDFRRHSTRIYARLPSDEEARLLKQPANQPVLVSEALDTSPDGRPLSLGTTVFAGARVQLTVG